MAELARGGLERARAAAARALGAPAPAPAEQQHREALLRPGREGTELAALPARAGGAPDDGWGCERVSIGEGGEGGGAEPGEG